MHVSKSATNKTRVKQKIKTRDRILCCIFVINRKKMNTKLTLTIEQDIIERAKKYAKDKNRSLSDIIENYLKLLTNKDSTNETELNPVIESLKGSFKMPKNFDYKKELRNRLDEKYL